MSFIFSQALSKADTDKTQGFSFNLEQLSNFNNEKTFCYINYFLFIQNQSYADVPHFLDFKFILNQSAAGKKAQDFLKDKLDKGIKGLKEKEKQIQEEKKLFNKKNYFC